MRIIRAIWTGWWGSSPLYARRLEEQLAERPWLMESLGTYWEEQFQTISPESFCAGSKMGYRSPPVNPHLQGLLFSHGLHGAPVRKPRTLFCTRAAASMSSAAPSQPSAPSRCLAMTQSTSPQTFRTLGNKAGWSFFCAGPGPGLLSAAGGGGPVQHRRHVPQPHRPVQVRSAEAGAGTVPHLLRRRPASHLPVSAGISRPPGPPPGAVSDALPGPCACPAGGSVGRTLRLGAGRNHPTPSAGYTLNRIPGFQPEGGDFPCFPAFSSPETPAPRLLPLLWLRRGLIFSTRFEKPLDFFTLTLLYWIYSQRHLANFPAVVNEWMLTGAPGPSASHQTTGGTIMRKTGTANRLWRLC